jgi:hypothetical protein
MNWEAINAIAQLVSSFGVVVSLWYLAVQVHRSTRIAKLAAQDAAMTALRDVTRPFSRRIPRWDGSGAKASKISRR